MNQEYGEARTRALEKYVGVVSLTKVEAMEILKTIWPDAPAVEVLKAAMICHQYGLNPLMKHVFLIPFKRRKEGRVVGEDWVTVLGITVNRLLAQRKHNYSYLDLTPRRMTEGEQEKILGEVDDSRIWAITMIKDMDTHAEAMGVGSWPKDEVPYGAEKGNTKLNMASIRSERQALDRQYPGEMPQGVEVIDEEYIPIEGEPLTRLPEGGEKTGEPPGEKVGARAPTKAMAQAKKSESAPAEPVVDEQEGLSIDPTWLNESQKELKWTDDTCKTFLVSQYKVSPQGTREEVIKRLTREQAEEFVKEINSRLEKQQASLF